MRKEVIIQLHSGNGVLPLTKPVICNGVALKLYSIGWLSYYTRLAKVTLRLWERTGILPPPVMRLAGQNRWYTPLEVTKFSQRIIDHYNSPERNLDKLAADLTSISKRIRVFYKTLNHTAAKDTLELPNEQRMSDAITEIVTREKKRKRQLKLARIHESQNQLTRESHYPPSPSGSAESRISIGRGLLRD